MGQITLEACRGRVVIKKDEPKEITEGGIHIPEAAQDVPRTGTVVSVGPGAVSDLGYVLPMDCEPGDRVLFHKYAGLNVIVEGEEFYVIQEKDILLKL